MHRRHCLAALLALSSLLVSSTAFAFGLPVDALVTPNFFLERLPGDSRLVAFMGFGALLAFPYMAIAAIPLSMMRELWFDSHDDWIRAILISYPVSLTGLAAGFMLFLFVENSATHPPHALALSLMLTAPALAQAAYVSHRFLLDARQSRGEAVSWPPLET
jgi:hypothetical protein